MRSRTTRVLFATVEIALVSALLAGGGARVAGAAGAIPAKATTSPPPATLYFIGQTTTGTMYWLNTTTNKIEKKVEFSAAPRSFVLGPGGKIAYVLVQSRPQAASSPFSLVPVNTATGRAGKAIALGNDVFYDMVITPDGKTIYIIRRYQVMPVSTVTGKVGKPVAGGGPIAITPNGKTLYVVGTESVTPVSTATNRAGKTIAVPAAWDITNLAVTPNGATVYIVSVSRNEISGTVTPVSTATNKAGKAINITTGRPVGVTFTPSGREAYVCEYYAEDSAGYDAGGPVTPITVATNKADKAIKVGGTATESAGIAIPPNGKIALVSVYPNLSRSGSVVPITIMTNKAGKAIPVPWGGPSIMVVTPNGKTAYVAGEISERKLLTINMNALRASPQPVYYPDQFDVSGMEMYPSPTPWIPGT